jgi:hypothetical protein
MPENMKPDGFYSSTGDPLPGGGHQVLVNGRWFTLTGLAQTLDKHAAELASARERIREVNARYVDFQAHVHSVFAELVEDGDLSKEVANEVLDGLGLDRLATEYEVEVTHTATLLVESTLSHGDLGQALAEAGARLEVGEGADFSVEDERTSK